MIKNFSSFEVGEEVTVVTGVGDNIFGLVSFIDLESRTMSVLVKKGSHRSKDVNLVINGPSLSLEKGWGDESNREVALRSLTPPS